MKRKLIVSYSNHHFHRPPSVQSTLIPSTRGTTGALTRPTRDPQDLLGNILRHEGLQPLVHLLGRVGVAAEPRHRELGLDHARADVAHANVIPDEFAEEGTGKLSDGVLCGRACK